MKLILITGMSGADKSVALKTLEDLGFEAIDNIPLNLLPAAVAASSRDLAVGSDVRSRDFSSDHFRRAVEELKAIPGLEFTLLFLDCDDEELRRRFTETRRRHPLAEDRTVLDGIRHERRLIGGMRDLADTVIDTSDYESGELRRVLTERLAGDGAKSLSVALVSFSFRHGIPREADMLFDVRFLKNPHYDPALKPQTGLDPAVGAYVEKDPDFKRFFDHVTGLLLPLLPRFVQEGKHYLTVAVGCTGGRHRSVHVAQKLGGFLRDKGYNVTISHRDLTT